MAQLTLVGGTTFIDLDEVIGLSRSKRAATLNFKVYWLGVSIHLRGGSVITVDLVTDDVHDAEEQVHAWLAKHFGGRLEY